jgi:hypothetical protein
VRGAPSVKFNRMQSSHSRGARTAGPLALAMVAAAVVVTPIATVHAGDGDGENDDRGCGFVDGPFHSSLVPPPTCTSPVGLCTHGELQGDFPAVYDFTFATLQSANDPSDPTEFVYTGHSTLTTPHGTISTNDSGVIHMMGPTAASPFVTTASVASGTERFENTTGVFVASGSLDTTTGDSVGTYFARVCRTSHER